MGDVDVGDSFAGWREESQRRRARNRDGSASMLKAAGVSFTAKNNGAHLIVEVDDRTIDFWPGTGLWIDRATQERKRGVRPLLAHLRRPT